MSPQPMFTVTVRLPKDVYRRMARKAREEKSKPTTVARETLCAVYGEPKDGS